MAAGDAEGEQGIDVFVAGTGRDAFVLVGQLRGSGLRAQMEQAGRSLKGQLKQADRLGARWTVILGDTIEVKDMESGEQQTVSNLDEAAQAGRAGATRSRSLPAPNVTGRTWPASRAPTQWASRCESPAGCTGAETTAGSSS